MQLTFQQGRTEAERCLYCFDAPCTQVCPVHIDIPKFIAMIKSGNLIGAAEVVRTSHALANICGKVCPEEIFCQSVCNRMKQDSPVRIRELHFFATQQEWKEGYSGTLPFPKNGKSVGVIGGGPAGLGCAFELVKMGYDVHVYDAKGFGGVPQNSIPTFRLNDDELRSDIEFLSPFVHSHQKMINTEAFENIRKQHDAVFIGIGLGLDKPLGIPGEHLPGVVPVLRFLERAKRNAARIGKRVVIVGGGNVSLDAAATAKHLGADEVILLYRRSEMEMKVWKSELEEAKKHGVQIQFLTIPIEIVGEERVAGVLCRRTRLSGQRDASGRPIPVEIPGSDFDLEADCIIIAIGQVIQADFVSLFERTPQGFIRVDEGFRTSLDGVFAGGDAIQGEGTIVQSVAHGKTAAHAIHDYLTAETRREQR
ncbi:MAG: FAD-dependent oxidoreductase [Bacteroidetes bacterium]|nr:FAD-dependent oxidoreductase [Bacteroidota bacterium]MCW5895327.1 FAD-dependent oxidoreductase [Bacteroidota bacterium]